MLDIKELKANIRTITECENILTYLDVISSNPSLSYLNHLLLFAQGKRTEVVCGRGAWEAMGRKIKENAQMLHIIYPAIVITEEGVPYKELDKDVVDIETLACRLLCVLNSLYKNELTTRYKIETVEDEDGYELLKKVGKARGMLVSGGEINTERAAITVLDEFRGGKLGRITLELPKGE